MSDLLRLRRWALAALLAIAAAPAQADQNAPALDGLFEELQAAATPRAATETERRIWRLWEEHTNAEIGHRMQRGKVLMASGRLDRALIVYDNLVEDRPNFAEAWNKRATVHYLAGDFEASMRDIQRTLALEPRHFGALSGMSLIFEEVERYAEALEALEAALAVHPQLRGGRQRLEKLEERLDQRRI